MFEGESAAHDRLIAISGLFTCFACVISILLIFLHNLNYTRHRIQQRILPILWLCPIYAITSYLSICFLSSGLYFDAIRDCYESYTLYNFFGLLLAYLTEDDEEDGQLDLVELNLAYGKGIEPWNGDENDNAIESRNSSILESYLLLGPDVYLPWPFHICYSDPLPKGKRFLAWCKGGIMQFILVKISVTFITIICELCGKYHEGNLSPKYFYLYSTIFLNISVTTALLVLFVFYKTLKRKLEPFEPFGKFVVIKSIIALMFWQSLILHGLVKNHIVQLDSFPPHDQARTLQDLFVTIEMGALSLVLWRTFTYTPFVIRTSQQLPSSSSSIPSQTLRRSLLSPSSSPSSSSSSTSSSSTNSYDQYAKVSTRDDATDSRGSMNHPAMIRSFTSKGKHVSPTSSQSNIQTLHNQGDNNNNSSEYVDMIMGRDSVGGGGRNSKDSGSRRVSFADRPIFEPTASQPTSQSVASRGGWVPVLPTAGIPSLKKTSAGSSFTSSSSSSSSSLGSQQREEGGITSFLNKNFALRSAVKDLNDSSLPIVLPTSFKPSSVSFHSNPEERL